MQATDWNEYFRGEFKTTGCQAQMAIRWNGGLSASPERRWGRFFWLYTAPEGGFIAGQRALPDWRKSQPSR